MKKIIVLIGIVLVACGCSSSPKSESEELEDEFTEATDEVTNVRAVP